MKRIKRDSLLLHTRSRCGHRGAFEDFAKASLNAGSCAAFGALTSRGPVLFLMADDGFQQYAVTATARAALGRRTVGLLFRPIPVLEGKTSIQTLKGLTLRFLRKLPGVRTLTIIPFAVDSRLSNIADNWIHDFQLWDLGDEERALVAELRTTGKCSDRDATDLYRKAKANASGRRIVASVGAQNTSKGLPILATAFANGELSDWSILAAGTFEKSLEFQRNQIAGSPQNSVIPRRLTDKELLASYAAADVMWCLYHPMYNQASGILGRAVQLGVPVIVRDGSVSQTLCELESIPHIVATESGSIGKALQAFTYTDQQTMSKAACTKILEMRTQNLSKLKAAIWDD